MNNGFILHEGDGVVCILTTRSANRKTGNMGQCWTLCSETDPVSAARLGADSVVCGDCAMWRWCYVQWPQAPAHVWRKHRSGGYPPVDWAALDGALIRVGAAGDPAAVPVDVWAEVVRRAAGHVGYTHMWRRPAAQPLRQYFRASVESPAQQAEAAAMGWRTFRVKAPDMPKLAGEMTCPASVVGSRVTCARCLTCHGGYGPNVVIDAHGQRAAPFAAWLHALARESGRVA